MKSIRYFAVCFPLLCASAFADRLFTTTGKILEGKVTEAGEKYKVEFPNSVSLELPKSLVKELQLDDVSSYVPKDDKEKEMMAKGMVRFKDQWLSKDRYAAELKKDQEAAKKKFADYKAHQTWGREWVKQTKHFFVHCNISPELLDEYCEVYEHFFEAYGEKFKIDISPANMRDKMEVNVFKSEKDYLEYSKMDDTNGYFSAGDRALYLFHDHNDPHMSQATLFHEGTHMINYLVNPELFGAIPIWVEESLAEYFAHTRYEENEKKQKKIIPGEIAEDRLSVVQEIFSQEGTEVYLQKLLTTPQAKFDADCYALGWSFVHFLFSHPKYVPGFVRYVEDIYQGKGLKFEKQGQTKTISNDEAIKGLLKYIGVKDLPTLEKEWISYVMKLKQPGGRGFYYRALTAKKWDPQPAMGKGRRFDALELINKAIDELGFKTSQAYYVRAMIHDYRKDKEKAFADLLTASEIDPTNDRYHVAKAWYQYQEQKYPEAESSLKLAMLLEPTELNYPVFFQEFGQRQWKTSPIQKPKIKQ